MTETNTYIDTSSSIDTTKTNVYDDYLKLMKYLEINENINSFEPLYPGVSMIYPINAWTFWYRDPTKSHLKYTWEESLTKIGTVRDITSLWKSVIYLTILFPYIILIRVMPEADCENVLVSES